MNHHHERSLRCWLYFRHFTFVCQARSQVTTNTSIIFALHFSSNIMKSTIMIWNNRRSAPRPTSPSLPPDRVSDYELALMPRDRIFKRALTSWSVHRSLTTSKWIATLAIKGRNTREKSGHVQFTFSSQREASKFCKAYAPPRADNAKTCRLCQKVSTERHCRNCGVTVCDDCSTRWGFKMVPKTYSSTPALTVRVCRSCDWLSNAFCLALLEGRYHDALTLYDSVSTRDTASFFVTLFNY